MWHCTMHMNWVLPGFELPHVWTILTVIYGPITFITYHTKKIPALHRKMFFYSKTSLCFCLSAVLVLCQFILLFLSAYFDWSFYSLKNFPIHPLIPFFPFLSFSFPFLSFSLSHLLLVSQSVSQITTLILSPKGENKQTNKQTICFFPHKVSLSFSFLPLP